MLTASPIELKDANAFVERLHRHHDPVYRDKCRVAAIAGGAVVGVVQLARPVARGLDDGKTIEVVRLCTDGTHNACSFLYGRAARIARELGYSKIITYILDTEDGASLRASGWHHEADTRGGSWDCQSRPRSTTAPTARKQRWEKELGGNNMNRLQVRRLELNMTQPQVSEKLKEIEPRADVGMVSRYEKGVCLPTGQQLSALEEIYGISRTELYDTDDLDLLGVLRNIGQPFIAGGEDTETAPPDGHHGRFRKCYRISREFAASLPDDLLSVCGYSSWQSWHDAALKRLVGEYAARKRGTKIKEEKQHERRI